MRDWTIFPQKHRGIVVRKHRKLTLSSSFTMESPCLSAWFKMYFATSTWPFRAAQCRHVNPGKRPWLSSSLVFKNVASCSIYSFTASRSPRLAALRSRAVFWEVVCMSRSLVFLWAASNDLRELEGFARKNNHSDVSWLRPGRGKFGPLHTPLRSLSARSFKPLSGTKFLRPFGADAVAFFAGRRRFLNKLVWIWVSVLGLSCLCIVYLSCKRWLPSVWGCKTSHRMSNFLKKKQRCWSIGTRLTPFRHPWGEKLSYIPQLLFYWLTLNISSPGYRKRKNARSTLSMTDRPLLQACLIMGIFLQEPSRWMRDAPSAQPPTLSEPHDATLTVCESCITFRKFKQWFHVHSRFFSSSCTQSCSPHVPSRWGMLPGKMEVSDHPFFF